VVAVHVRPGQAAYGAPCTTGDSANCTAGVELCSGDPGTCACDSQHYLNAQDSCSPSKIV